MPAPQTDEELVSRTIGGEEDAFSQLYDRYRRPVFATAYRIIQDSEEAQDATQEIFIKIYRSLRQWNPGKAKFSTWLYRLACNQAIDSWRRRQRRSESQFPEGSEGHFRNSVIEEAIRSPSQELASK